MFLSNLKIILSTATLICCITFSSIASSTLNTQDTTCLALFAYLPVDDQSIELFNLSLGTYQEAVLEMGDGTIYTNPAFPFTHSYETAGIFNVCLSIKDTLSCSSEMCLVAFTLSEEIICKQLPDCVLPGDTNKDGSINIFDAFAIGLGYNLTGIVRPNATIEAVLQAAADWVSSLINGLDSKHADCDGNGIINRADFLAIDQNYQRVDKNEALEIDPQNPIVTLEFASDTLFLDNAAGNSITLPVTLSIGSEEQPIEDFYGIALAFDYQNSQVHDINTTLLPHEELPSETIFKEEKIFNEEQYGIVISNTQQEGNSIYGPIAELNIVIIEDLLSARTIQIDINDVKVINSEGKELEVSVAEEVIDLTIISAENRTVLTNTNNLLDANISITPNPAVDYLQITLDGPIKNQEGHLVIYNGVGERMLEQAAINDQTILDITNLPMGIYWIELLFEEGRISRKVVKGY